MTDRPTPTPPEQRAKERAIGRAVLGVGIAAGLAASTIVGWRQVLVAVDERVETRALLQEERHGRALDGVRSEVRELRGAMERDRGELARWLEGFEERVGKRIDKRRPR